MDIKSLYQSAIKQGITWDPRGEKAVLTELDKVKKGYEKKDEDEKEFFDTESLYNPYSDTRILNGSPDTQIKRILVGIDIDTSEIILSYILSSTGKKIDAIISHHPQGCALAGLPEVMGLQADLLNTFGVPLHLADFYTSQRISEVSRKIMPVNHTKPVDAARLLNIPFLCIHTPADNAVWNFLQKKFDTLKPDTVGDVLKTLRQIPEYKEATKRKAGPKIITGSPDSRCGKIMVDMTGGTEGTMELYDRLSSAGVGTLVCMHLSEEHFKKVQEQKINVIIAGHIASDILGLNLLFDAILPKDIETMCCSGFKRNYEN